jgi:hypothetical protein
MRMSPTSITELVPWLARRSRASTRMSISAMENGFTMKSSPPTLKPESRSSTLVEALTRITGRSLMARSRRVTLNPSGPSPG